jgi:hypothetical protein
MAEGPLTELPRIIGQILIDVHDVVAFRLSLSSHSRVASNRAFHSSLPIN